MWFLDFSYELNCIKFFSFVFYRVPKYTYGFKCVLNKPYILWKVIKRKRNYADIISRPKVTVKIPFRRDNVYPTLQHVTHFISFDQKHQKLFGDMSEVWQLNEFHHIVVKIYDKLTATFDKI
jgi:hypothetical protein